MLVIVWRNTLGEGNRSTKGGNIAQYRIQLVEVICDCLEQIPLTDTVIVENVAKTYVLFLTCFITQIRTFLRGSIKGTEECVLQLCIQD